MTASDRRRDPAGNGVARRSLPEFTRRIYMPHTIAAIVAEMAEEGHEPSLVLEGTGVAPEQLGCHTTKVSYRDLDRVIRNTIALSNNAAIALQAGLRMHITAYGMYGYALLSSATRAEARAFAAKYIRAVGPCCDFTVASDDVSATITFDPIYWPDPTDRAHQFAIEFALAAHLTATRDWAGSHFAFSRVRLDYAAPSHAPTYATIFECDVVFRQRSCGFERPKEDGRVRLADPRSHAIAREMCEQLLEEVNRTGGVTAEIRRILVEQPGRYTNIQTMAERLQMHPRALRRKLEMEGASYRDVLAEVRTRLAMEYLRKTHMTIEEIAGLVGYSDAANFRHAFIRWTGKSPSSFRKATRLE